MVSLLVPVTLAFGFDAKVAQKRFGGRVLLSVFGVGFGVGSPGT